MCVCVCVCVPGELCQQPASQSVSVTQWCVSWAGKRGCARDTSLLTAHPLSPSLCPSPRASPHPLQLFDRVWLTCILVDKEITWSLS